MAFFSPASRRARFSRPAIDVLEARVLLSGSQGHKVAAPPAPIFFYAGEIRGTVSIPDFHFSSSFRGGLSVKNVSLVKGKTVSATMSIGNIPGYAIGSIKGTLNMKIDSVTGDGPVKTITLTTPGKKDGLTGTYFLGGKQTVTLKPKAVPFTLVVDTSNFSIVSFNGTYVLPAIPGLTAGGDATFTVSPTAIV